MALPSVAWAQQQPWLADRRYTEGKGIEAAIPNMHPGIAAEFGYDSNYFFRGDDEDPIKPPPSHHSQLLDRHADGSTARRWPPSRRHAFRAAIHATYDEFFPVSGSQAGKDSMADNRNVGGRAEANVDFFPGKVVFGSLRVGVTRNIQPSNAGIQAESFNRIAADGGAARSAASRRGHVRLALRLQLHGHLLRVGRSPAISTT